MPADRRSQTPAAAAPAALRAIPSSVAVIEPPHLASTRRIAGEVTIGRSSASTITLDDSFASTHHARIWSSDGGAVYVEDVGSTNGTLINGRPIASRSAETVSAGDRITIGHTVLEMR